MKIKFEELDYQSEAIKSITGIFEGQESFESNFSVQTAYDTQLRLGSTNLTELGIANNITIYEEEILQNIQKIQLKNGLPQTKAISKDNLNFCVEMETGTGKTYVYLKTIMELNKKYGFKKFIIVVPSIAIKEGTNKSLEMTKDNFKGLFDNVNYNYFTYDSSKLEQVRNFATSNNIEIMVINIAAFNRSFKDPSKEDSANVIHRYNDKLSGYKPIDFISETRPIVIIDEPQKVDTTDKSKEAIASLNPLFTLRYSATHRVKENLMYKLDSIDAYEKKLVKEIEVAGIQAPENYNGTYIKVLGIKATKSGISADLELDVRQKSGIKRMKKKVKKGDFLEDITKNIDYEGFNVVDISAIEDDSWIDLGKEKLVPGQILGGQDPDTIKRLQIRKTIEEHLEKEKKLNPLGVKVLSLFFIDKVAHYRTHDKDSGELIKGKYYKWFEEEYMSLIRTGKYTPIGTNLVEIETDLSKIHNGYFSGDKKKTSSGEEFMFEKDTKGTTNADEDTYALIMKDKEKLLSIDNPLRFIFSHSALGVGWDNPNVFQICTLAENASEVDRRQKIGRGLRICVNQSGERLYGFEYNTLTVMANESYEKFVSELQKEISDEMGIEFGVVDTHTFANISYPVDEINSEYLGEEKSKELFNFLVEKTYIDKKGKVQDSLKTAIKNNIVEIPEEFKEVKHHIVSKLRKVAGNLNIKNADNKITVKINKQVMISEDFKLLWDKVKQKTTFKVDFDVNKLIEKASEDLQNQLYFSNEKYKYYKAKTEITKGGLLKGAEKEDSISADNYDKPLIPDILSFLQSETSLTRKTIVDILIKSNTLRYLERNPQRYVDDAVKILKNTMSTFIVDGIKYEKLENKFYGQELFDMTELKIHMKEGMVESTKSPYTYVIDDSNVEQNMAKRLESSDNVKVYAKLPDWFKIDTPLGSYNPDWAVLYEKDGIEKLYLIVETKGTLFEDELRPKEKAKIKCGRKHFEAISEETQFIQTNTFENLEAKI
jgi:type III restriction enzyme